MGGTGKTSADSNNWGSFEPYAQLVISQLPRAASVTLFDAKGELRWSTGATTRAPISWRSSMTHSSAPERPESLGEVRTLSGGLPVYIYLAPKRCAARAIAIFAIACRRADTEARSFALVYALLRPALECLRRDFLARAAIFDLGRTRELARQGP